MTNKTTTLFGISVFAALMLGTVAFAPQAYAGLIPTLDPPAITETLEQGELLEVPQTLDPQVLPPSWTSNTIGPFPSEDCLSSGFLDNIFVEPDNPAKNQYIWTIQPNPDAILDTYMCTAVFGVQYLDEGGHLAFTEFVDMLMTITVESSVDPVEKIEGLIDGVEALDLNNGNKNALTKKLVNAIKNITNEDPTDDLEVCEKLQSFIDQLNAMVNSGKLTEGEVAGLISDADECIGALCFPG